MLSDQLCNIQRCMVYVEISQLCCTYVEIFRIRGAQISLANKESCFCLCTDIHRMSRSDPKPAAFDMPSGLQHHKILLLT